MLTFFKFYLKKALIPIVFLGGVVIMFVSAFKEAKYGLVLLIFLIPQPNIWYKFHGFVLGKDFIDLLYFAILFGIFVQSKGFARTNNSVFIIIFILFSYLTLLNSSLRFGLPMPISTSNWLFVDWKNYAQMIFLYFIVLNIVKEEEDQKKIILLMAIVVLFIAVRSYRGFSGGADFSYDKRYGGPFEFVGLGANHFGAFMEYCCAFFLGMFFFEKNKRKRLFFLATVLFSLHPILFAYSRGVYLALAIVLLFYGVTKKKILLILLISVVFAWQTLLPPSVVDRISMTKTEDGQLEESASDRLVLWETAINIYEKNPIFGIGFSGFQLSLSGARLTDTHNFFLKTLCEQGLIGIVLLFILFFKAFFSGFRLYKIGNSSFHKALGFSFMGCVLGFLSPNVFGDRFSYFVLGSYFWIFWALVDRGILLSQEAR